MGRRGAFPLLLPLVYAAAPPLMLLAGNAGQAQFSDVLLPVGLLAAATLILYPLFVAMFRSPLRGGVALSLFWLLVFSYGHVAAIVGRFPIAGMNPANPKCLIPVTLVVGGLCARAIRRAPGDPRTFAKVLMVSGLALILSSLVTLGLFRGAHRPSASASVVAPETITAGKVPRTPDIYYIIFDRYASNATLTTRYGWDNGPLLDFLRRRGFYVADDSRSNYHVTAQSLASSLNMTHLLGLSETVGKESSDWRPVFDMLEDNQVTRFLLGQGYRYVHVGAKWPPTARNRHASVNYKFSVLPEFSAVLVSTTAFYPVLYRLGVTNPDREKYERVNHQLGILSGLPRRQGTPLFVFAHFLVPHGPYVFNRDGSYRTPEQVTAHPEAESYVEQIRYLNGRIEGLVDSLLAAYPPGAPPVIILQGDEGPYPERTHPHSFVWTEATNEEISEKMRILNAIYAPGCEASFYPAVTPVNTFRLVFNCYFQTGLPLLPDRSYAYHDLKRLYDFFETTARIDAVGK